MFGFFKSKKPSYSGILEQVENDMARYKYLGKLKKDNLYSLLRQTNDEARDIYKLKLMLEIEIERREKVEFEQIVKGAK